MGNLNDFQIENGVLVKYTGSGGDVVIPESVTSIGERAFSFCEGLTSVVIPEGVTSIGEFAFLCCYSLTSVMIAEGVTSIGYSAFHWCKSLTSVEIPESVTDIGDYAFDGCEMLSDADGYVIVRKCVYGYYGNKRKVRIPEGTTTIGAGAFKDCTKLTSVVIPESVTRIEKYAFKGCVGLTSVEIPESVTDIEDYAFEACERLADADGYVMIQRRICGYYGKGGIAHIPEGATSIEPSAFKKCNELTEVVIPEGVINIGKYAFYGCRGLTSVVIPESVTSVEEEAFSGCHKLKTVDFMGEMPTLGPKVFQDCTQLVLKPEVYFTTQKLEPSLANGVPGEHAAVSAYIQLYQRGKVWTSAVDASAKKHAEEIAEEIYALLQDSAKVSPKMGTNAADFILKWRQNIQPELIQKLYQLLQNKKCKKAVECLESDIGIADLVKQADDTVEAQPQHPVEQIVHANWKYSSQVDTLKKYIEKGIHYRDTEEVSSPEAVIFVIAAYIAQVAHHREDIKTSVYKTGYFPFCAEPIADQVAAELDQEELLTLLEDLTYEKEIWDCVVPLGRYADIRRAERLVSQIQKWSNWSKYNKTVRQNVILARGALMLNDTRPAMLHMEKVGRLEDYAKLRGTDAATLRDTVLAEFGLDRQGRKEYDLGNTTVAARLNPDLTLSLYDTVTGELIKSIPKKGAEPEKYEAAKADFTDLKKNINKVVKARNDLLFEAFLSGKVREAGSWKQVYLTNPVLNQVAKLLVWNQGEKTFTLKGQEPIGSDGQAYTLTEEPVGVAHPIMMTKEEQSAWQSYFTENHLKQPFEQVWEPQYDPDEIAANRYEGCQISIYRFKNQTKHGIIFFNEDYGYNVGFLLKECRLKYERTSHNHHKIEPDETFTLGEFEFDRYTRHVNHIVYLLDKKAVTERILRDDVTIAPLLGSFTAAQISEFIRLATEKGCTNVTALLLEYQNEHFGQFDPMAEFTLDE
jgi:hypothetical protein